MKTAVSTYSFARLGISQAECIRRAAEMGFDGVEIVGLDCPEEKQAEYAAELAAAAKACGIDIVCFTVSADLLRAGETERIKRQVDLAAALGAPRMRHDAAWAAPEGKSFEETLPFLARQCAAIAAYAQAKGVKTMVENHGFFMQDSGRMVALVQAAAHPNFGLLCDMGNFMCADEQSAEAVRAVAPYAVYVHAKDFLFQAAGNAEERQGWLKTRGGNFLQGTVIGNGAVQVKRCLDILKQHGYDGFVSLEFEGPEEPTEAIRTGLERLKSYF